VEGAEPTFSSVSGKPKNSAVPGIKTSDTAEGARLDQNV
jgi:hypothetical protein